MSKRLHVLSALVIVLSLLATSIASAHHPDGGDRFGGGELFPGEGVVTSGDKQQHGETTGHLPAKQENVAVIGKAAVSAPEGTDGDMTGRVADVAAYGNYAFLTAFRGADCLGGGAWIVDMSDPTEPEEVEFLPTTDGIYAGEGAQVITAEHGPYAGRQLFIHQNETCNAAMAAASGKERYRGGINIWDVTDPDQAVLLAEHIGDTDGPVAPQANDSHSMFAWNSHVDEKVYVVLVDNYEFEDLDIVDITDPANPVMVNDTLDLFTVFGVGQANPPHLGQIFSHDMMVYRKGERYIMNVSYWDGGYVLLDVTDPTPGNVTLIADWDFPEFDDQRLLRGEEVPPAGNAHQSEFSPDFNFLIGTDEDFSPFSFTFTSNAFEGERTAIEAAFTPSIASLPGREMAGEVVHVGRGCPADPGDPPASGLTEDDPYLADPAGKIALVQRGACRFDHKVARAQHAGAVGVIVYGLDGDESLVLMGGENPVVSGPDGIIGTEITIPALYVQNSTGVLLRDASPPVLANAQAVFTGWGYVRLFRTKVPGEVGSTGSIQQIDTYAIPEAQDPDYALGFGDLTIHEVATDPRPGTNLAYFSYYSGGFRVAEYDNGGIREVGAFIDEGGNNFWGVEVHKHPDGQYYVLASDRDFGLYIFQYAGKIPGKDRGAKEFNPRP
jgi:hypothetical protein